MMSALALDTTSIRESVRAIRDAASRLRRQSDDLFTRADQLERELLGAAGIRPLGGMELLAAVDELVPVGETLHYGDMLDRLQAAGVTPSGVDPPATLLANLHRHQGRYEPVGSRSGRYRRRT